MLMHLDHILGVRIAFWKDGPGCETGDGVGDVAATPEIFGCLLRDINYFGLQTVLHRKS
jgi:hypothetical protein